MANFVLHPQLAYMGRLPELEEEDLWDRKVDSST
jgi:hypothetical protein